MARLLPIALLGLLPALTQSDDKAAEELLKAFQQKLESARTVRAEFSMSVTQAGTSLGVFSTAIKLKGKDRWTLDLKQDYSIDADKRQFNALCDGRKIRLAGNSNLKPESLAPEATAASIRRILGGSFSEEFLYLGEGSADAIKTFPAPVAGNIKDGGREILDGKEVRVIAYSARHEYAGSELDIGVRLYLDPVEKRPLKREFSFQGVTWDQTINAFAFDEDLPDSDFSYQSNRRLARTRAVQLATSVGLFGRFTGRHPRGLEDLVRRPQSIEKEVFWPEGGFVLGGALPKDPWGRAFELRADAGIVSVVSLGADGKPGGKGDDEDAAAPVPAATRRAVGAPAERLAKHYSARVQLHLLAAVVRAFRESYGELPRKKAALWERPEWAEVWPDGGWLPGGRVPDDPWGEPWRIVSEVDYVRVQAQDPRARLLPFKALSREERERMEEIARPRLSAGERRELARLIAALGDDDLTAREKAEVELRAWGPAALPVIEERLQVEKDAEVVSRLEATRVAHPPARPAWLAELKPLTSTVATGPVSEDSENACRNNLSQLWKMENVYMGKLGHRRMLTATGRDFWLALTKTTPPLIDSTLYEIFVCPDSGMEKGDGVCTYAGPASDVNAMKDDDVVGMCDDEAHGEQVILLRKSGVVQVVPRDGDLHRQAMKQTKR
jgi:general secretion pathway protein G